MCNIFYKSICDVLTFRRENENDFKNHFCENITDITGVLKTKLSDS